MDLLIHIIMIWLVLGGITVGLAFALFGVPPRDLWRPMPFVRMVLFWPISLYFIIAIGLGDE